MGTAKAMNTRASMPSLAILVGLRPRSRSPDCSAGVPSAQLAALGRWPAFLRAPLPRPEPNQNSPQGRRLPASWQPRSAVAAARQLRSTSAGGRHLRSRFGSCSRIRHPCRERHSLVLGRSSWSTRPPLPRGRSESESAAQLQERKTRTRLRRAGAIVCDAEHRRRTGKHI